MRTLHLMQSSGQWSPWIWFSYSVTWVELACPSAWPPLPRVGAGETESREESPAAESPEPKAEPSPSLSEEADLRFLDAGLGRLEALWETIWHVRKNNVLGRFPKRRETVDKIQIYYLVFLGLCAALSSLISSIFCIISSWCLTSGGRTSTFFFQMLERDRGRLKSPKNAFG